MALTTASILIGGKLISSIEHDLVVNTIKQTNNKIYELLVNSVYSNNYINDPIKKLDIEYKLKVIESYLKELENNESESIMLALKGIENICLKIHEDLDKIEKVINTHNEKWFYYFRQYDNDINLNNLQEDVRLLDERFKLFSMIRKYPSN